MAAFLVDTIVVYHSFKSLACFSRLVFRLSCGGRKKYFAFISSIVLYMIIIINVFIGLKDKNTYLIKTFFSDTLQPPTRSILIIFNSSAVASNADILLARHAISPPQWEERKGGYY